MNKPCIIAACFIMSATFLSADASWQSADLADTIRVVGKSETVLGRYKEIRIVDRCASGDSSVLGLSPTEFCRFMNADPQGECFVYFLAFTNGLRIAYEEYFTDNATGFDFGQNDWTDIELPISTSRIPQFLAEVSVHELCHTLGLVSSQNFGSHDDISAEQSWNAGVAIANDADYHTTSASMVSNIWDKADMKNRLLWPNITPASNWSRYYLNPTIDFSEPSFTGQLP